MMIKNQEQTVSQNKIFRDELPGEKKTIGALLMTGYFIAISCMGYVAFFVFIQLSQIDRIVMTLNPETLTVEQFELLKNRILRGSGQLQKEVVGIAILGGIIAIIGGVYTLHLVVRPLRKLVAYTEGERDSSLPEIKSNNEIKQLATAIDSLTSRIDKEASENNPRPG